MQDVDLNWLAIVVAAAIPMILGAAWYSPLLFARPWMREVGKTPEEIQAGSRMPYLVAALASLVMSYALARVIRWAEADDLVAGVVVALLAWTGFVATTFAVNYAFGSRSRTLWGIDTGYYLVSLLLMGALHGAWD